MKKIASYPKLIRHLRRRERHEASRKRYRKLYLRDKRQSLLGIPRSEHHFLLESQDYEKVIAPEIFSFIENPEGVIRFLSNFEKAAEKGDTFIDLRTIKNISTDAIIALVSRLDDEKFSHGRKFRAAEPRDEKLKSIFIQSGIYGSSFRRYGKPVQAHGSIRKKHSHVVESTTARDLIHFATKRLFGEVRRFKGIQRTFIECMNNTVNHASPDETIEENWYATVYCDPKDKRAYFNFMDNGVGIFESIKLKGLTKAARIAGLKDNGEILKEILEGKIGSRTGLSYRGNGLPSIYQAFKRGQLSNLIIITNDVYADIEKDEFRILPRPFSGTFFHWELSNE